MSKESEYIELFRQEALENFEQLNNLFTELEKNHKNQDAINSIFRITHTLKGNAMGIGVDPVAKLAHVMEDVMGAVKNGEISLNQELFDNLFKANDKLGALIQALETGEKVSFLGINTKLKILLKNALESGAGDGDGTGDSADAEKSTSEINQAELTEEMIEEEEDEVDESASQPSITFTEVIQIPIKKMDELMNLVGQLIIERDRLISVNTEAGTGTSQFERLQRISSDLQYAVMNARMVQVGFLFNKFHRIVRDVGAIEKKKVNLEIKGTDVEIDRNILKIMSDSLIHLVRNAVSHGIEPASVRAERNKSDVGTITLNARYEKDNVVIDVSDDGNGIDAEAIRYRVVKRDMMTKAAADAMSDDDIIMKIFEPGFSNAEKVTEISGRGVGMDVVKRATESIGGHISLDTVVGHGSTVSLHLPSSLALKGALLFEIGTQEYAIPLSYTKAVISVNIEEIHKISDGLMINYLDNTISIVFLKDIINAKKLSELKKDGALHKTFEALEDSTELDVIVISYMGKEMGVVVDRLLLQREIIEKSLVKPLDKVKMISGTTILGNGNVCPIIDIVALIDMLYKTKAIAE
ncbi:chemotaxis protein CheA [Reichenbachiella versicolor]|uniref:chemotaxis protein CheA n=1 Tax=Reichenbachiella versicolor TaxID=1821036 RepID=UPI000D6DC8F4|nr:chemotaxis protein CheA [Reichenbachiella versicolor]